MHTKHSHLSKIRTAAATLCAALFLCTCSYERIPDDGDNNGQDGEYTTVTLSVNTAANEQNLSTRALTEGQEKAINSLYILAFQLDKNDTLTYRLKYYATGKPVTNSAAGQFTFALRLSVSGVADTKLLLVANQNPYSLVQTGLDYDEVQKKLIASLEIGSEAPAALATTGIPMFGYAVENLLNPSTPQKIQEGMILKANLLRALARVDVGVGQYNTRTGDWGGLENFKLTEVHVFKPQMNYSLLPLGNNLEYDASGTPSVTAPSLVGSPNDKLGETISLSGPPAITNQNYCKAEIYLPEFAFGLGAAVSDGNHTNRMALVIGGKYNQQTYYYRIDFTDASSNFKDVLRNNIYRFSITAVTQPGYTDAQKAYEGKPVGLDFNASVTPWGTGVTTSPDPDMLVRMNYNGINGTNIEAEMVEDVTTATFKILAKKDQFKTDGDRIIYYGLQYNTMMGEASDNTFNGYTNGGTYKDVQDALNREGPYPELIIAPDNATEAAGVAWRTGSGAGRVLNAKQACWDYRGQGHSDWRLPRLSELMLLWMNREAINSSKGFTSLGEGSETYWTGSEGTDDKAYTVDRNGNIKKEVKTVTHLVRCVRQVTKQN